VKFTEEKVNFGALGMLTKNLFFDVCQSPSEMADYEILVQDADWLRFCSLLCFYAAGSVSLPMKKYVT
jgi:hypothetical protein